MADVLRFSTNITEETLVASTRLHNQFPPDTAFPQIDVLSDGFRQLCAIIAKYNVQTQFRLRLLHRHVTISDGQILLGARIPERAGYWTCPSQIADIDLQNIHGHIFSIDPASYTSGSEMRDALVPSEFREGPPASVGTIHDDFFTEFSGCLWTNGFGDALGLEAIQGQDEPMVEFSFNTGSLLLPKKELGCPYDFQATGWTITMDGVVDKDNETRCVLAYGKHIEATRLQVKSVLDALRVLGDEGVLR